MNPNMKTVLLTGHMGFIGSALKNKLEKQGHRVLTIGRCPNSTFFADFCDPSSILKVELNCSIDQIVHCAAANETLISSDLSASFNVNVVTTRTLLELCKKFSVPEFVYLSTFHVYGKSLGLIDELTPTAPLNDYGLTHLLSEQIITGYCSWNGINHKILRPTNVFGIPHKLSEFNRWSLVPFQFIRSAFEKSEITIYSSGEQQRNFVSINDVIDSINLDFSGPLNIYGKDTLTIKAFAETISRRLSKYGNEIKVNILGIGNPDLEKLVVCNRLKVYTPEGSLENFIDNFSSLLKAN